MTADVPIRCVTNPGEVCEVDHIEPHAEGGETTAANGRLLCRLHNRLCTIRPWPEPPAPPQPDDLVETDPVFPTDMGDEGDGQSEGPEPC